MLDFEHESSYTLKATKVTKNIRLRLVLVYVSYKEYSKNCLNL